MKPAAESSFDVALWLLDRARTERTPIQPRRLQCLLFLAQAHYAAQHRGRPLMPSVFVVDQLGPLEPNLHRTLEFGEPALGELRLDEAVRAHLDMIWQLYGRHSAGRLAAEIAERAGKTPAFLSRDRSMVGIDDMRQMFPTRVAAAPAAEAPRPKREKILRTAAGDEVRVTPWAPRSATPYRPR